jgi:cyclic pyranopterin phosphate synthase
MRDITHKQITLRTAGATGILFCSAETIALIREDRLPKGNLFDVARAAGFLGAKQTPQLLPHCHPVTIDGMDIQFEFLDPVLHANLFGEEVVRRSGIVIRCEARSIGRTGIEMEVLVAISVAALEIYDMLKPVDRQLEIGHIRLLEKRGGKSDREISPRPVRCSCAQIPRQQECGRIRAAG